MSSISSTSATLSFIVRGKRYTCAGTAKTKFQSFFRLIATKLEPEDTSPPEIFTIYNENFPDPMGFDEQAVYGLYVKSRDKKQQHASNANSGITGESAGRRPSGMLDDISSSETTSAPLPVSVPGTPTTTSAPQQEPQQLQQRPATPPSPIHRLNTSTGMTAIKHVDPSPLEKEETTTTTQSAPANAQITLRDIHAFIDDVIEGLKREGMDLGVAVPTPRTSSIPSKQSSSSNHHDKIIALTMEGVDSNKLLKVNHADNIDYCTFVEMVRKKYFGGGGSSTPSCGPTPRSPRQSIVSLASPTTPIPPRVFLSYVDESGDVLDIDDDASFAVFLDQEAKKLKVTVTVESSSFSATTPGGGMLGQSGRDWGGPPSWESLSQTTTPRLTGVPLSATIPSKAHVAHNGAIYSCALSFDGQRLLTAGRDKRLRVWRTSDWHLLGELTHHRGFVLGCAFAPPKALRCVSCSDDKTAVIWDNNNMFRQRQVLVGHTDKVYGCAFSEDAAYIATGSCDKSVRIWDATTGSTARVIDRNNGSVFCVGFAKSSPAILFSAGDDSLVKMFDLRTPGVEVRAFRGHNSTVWSCQSSESEKYLVSSSMDHSVRVWDIGSGSVLSTWSHHCSPVHHAIFTPSERFVISCARDKCINVTEIASGKPVNILRGHSNIVYHLDLRDGLLASCSMDESVRLWEMPGGL
eukprot:PhF_6_TR9190/c0_g2_i2/m.14348